jgi:hypothetical protein
MENNPNSPSESDTKPALSYTSGQLSVGSTPTATPVELHEVRWSASEFIAHQKTTSWYLTLIMVTVIVSGIVFLLTRQYISAGVIVVLSVAFGVYGSVLPKSLEYVVDSSGITVEKKHFSYELFKLVQKLEGGMIPSITFIPVKRFAVPLTIYLSSEQEDQILDIVSEFLPIEIKQVEAIDKLVARLRF